LEDGVELAAEKGRSIVVIDYEGKERVDARRLYFKTGWRTGVHFQFDAKLFLFVGRDVGLVE
jgi:hypothetical protein